MSEGVALGLLQHYTSWQIVSYKPLYIGEEVIFNNVKCQVTSIHTFTEYQDVKNVYTLSIYNGVKSIYKTNPKVYGMSLPALVKERKGNTLRVHFDIDEKYEAKPKNQFFTYAIESSSWY